MKISVEVKELIQSQQDACLTTLVSGYRDCRGYVQAEEPYYWDHRKETTHVCYLHASSNLGAVLLKCPRPQNKTQNISNMYWLPLQSKSHPSYSDCIPCPQLPVFSGSWWQPYTSPSGPKFRIAEIILLTWSENSLHHPWCRSAAVRLFHCETLPVPLLFSKYS